MISKGGRLSQCHRETVGQCKFWQLLKIELGPSSEVFGTSIPTLAEAFAFIQYRFSVRKYHDKGVVNPLGQAQRHGMGWSSHQASKTKGGLGACEIRRSYDLIHLYIYHL